MAALLTLAAGVLNLGSALLPAVSYRPVRTVALAAGDPLGPCEEWPQAVRAFLAEAAAQGRVAAVPWRLVRLRWHQASGCEEALPKPQPEPPAPMPDRK